MRPNGVHLDFESGSPTDLKKTGVYVYAEDPRTRVWGFRYSWGDGKVYEWRPGYEDPHVLLEWIATGKLFVAHNAGFERTMWNTVLRKAHPHWPEVIIDQQDCTLARASAVTLPPGLGLLGKVLGLDVLKDEEGAKLMLRMAKPRKVHEDGRVEWWHEGDVAAHDRLMDYCGTDVLAEIEADKNLPHLTEHEEKIWKLDQLINDRGVRIDLDAAARAAELVDHAKLRTNVKMRELTNGEVKKVSDRNGLIAWFRRRGHDITSINKGNSEELLLMSKYTGDPLAEEVLELRNSAGKTSVAKYAKMLECTCEDGRARGLLAYHGATTGRWAGRLIQPQNLPRMDIEHDEFQINYVVDLLTKPVPVSEVYDLIELGIGPPMPWLSKTLRTMFIAEKGNTLYGGDFSNIEGRGNAWLANETWKLDAFRAFDAKRGEDLYKLAYAESFGVHVSDVGKTERQIGKVEELALGYQGSVGAFINMAAVYGLKPHMLVQPILDAVTAQEWDSVAKLYGPTPDKYGLPEEQWTALKTVVNRWRGAHPNIVQGWWDLGDAAIAAVSKPGSMHYVYSGRVCYMCLDGWLYCQLPSGRVLSYASPFIREKKRELVNAAGETYERVDYAVHYFTMFEGRWVEDSLYGGKQCENVVSGTCRCLLDRAMLRVEAAGYPLVLTVHDELVSEVPMGFGSVREYIELMAQGEEWATGFPIAAAAWSDPRYVK